MARYVLALLLAVLWLHGPPALASELSRFLEAAPAADLVPGADRLGPPEGDPPVAPAYAGDERIGYVYLNTDFADATGYSGKPVHILVGIDPDGVVRGARLVEHHEPIVLVGIPERRIREVIEGYVGLDAVARLRAPPARRQVDVVSGATVTVMVVDDSIVRSAIEVSRALGLGGLTPTRGAPAEAPPRRVDMSRDEVRDWLDLVADGSVRRLKLTVGEVNRAFETSGNAEAAARPEPGAPDEVFVELYAALVSVPSIGRSLLGDREYENLRAALAPGQHAILLAGRGRYSFKGSGYVRGGIFDRFHVVQNGRSIRFRDRHHERLRRLAAEGAPDLREVDLFRVPEDVAFDPAAPWRLDLLVSRPTGARTKAYLTFGLDYRLPERYLEPAPEPPARPAPAPAGAAAPVPARSPALWKTLWREKRGQVAVLAVALAVLTLVFFFQDWLVRRPRLFYWLRTGFLVFTAGWLGYYANAQLSIVNVLTVFHALVTGFDWGYFLMEPLIFILWGSVAAALILWGRGAFCGWLCPFGALQELLNRLAKALRVPQWQVPWPLHERLWALKYLIFLVLFGFSLHSLGVAERLAEVEPFKTAIVLKFDRAWPFVAFAGGLLLAGLFVERFYCRYLCALGAALALPAKLHTFDWLKRYRQCGNPCQRCRNDCMVQAIHPEGHINPNECLDCLHCQELYFDEQRCPVMIARRERRERQAARRGSGEESRKRLEQILVEVRAGKEQKDAEAAS